MENQENSSLFQVNLFQVITSWYKHSIGQTDGHAEKMLMEINKQISNVAQQKFSEDRKSTEMSLKSFSHNCNKTLQFQAPTLEELILQSNSQQKLQLF